MEEFELTIDRTKFRSTNGPWNDLMLNDPWSVGYVTAIIELKEHANKEAWENFYYETGKYREQKISRLNLETQKILQDCTLIKANRHLINDIPQEYKSYNTLLGRSFERLQEKGEILYERVKSNGYQLSLDECIECVRFRVICETWNGVVIRERNTIATLTRLLPAVEFVKVSGEMDHTFAVDYEVYKGGLLTSAIQIKPMSYTWSASYIQKARSSNQRKNEKYTELKKVKVYNVISTAKGEILNFDVIKYL
jgi:hypothetical protein